VCGDGFVDGKKKVGLRGVKGGQQQMMEPKKAGIVLPKMVVFDLDNCCWNPEMYQLRAGSSPFTYNPADNTCRSKRGDAVVELCSDVAAVWGSILNANARNASDATRVTLGEFILSQELSADVAACRKRNFNDKGDVLAKVSTLPGYTTKQKEFLCELLWEEVAFNSCPSSGTIIAIASCCDEPQWAREIMQKFRIFDPIEQQFTKTMAEAIESKDLVQIRHETKTVHHESLRYAFSSCLMYN
jgi:hypothetical protein